jgi:DNA-binding transcriptional LysR family regulator
MNLQQLRYLVEVADGPSLSAASRRLGISQPVLSRAIRALEHDLGVELVALDGRRLHVRDDAAPVVEAARAALAAVEKVSTVADRLHAREVTIAASPSHQTMLTGRLPELTRAAGTTVRLLTATDTDDMAALLRSGRADLGFGEAPLSPVADLTVRHLGVLELVLAVAAADLGSWPDAIRLGDHSPLRIAMLDVPERMEILEKIVANAGGSLETVFAADDRIVLLKAVETGVAPTVATRSLVEGNPLLGFRPFEPVLDYPIAALVDPDRTSPAAAAVLDALAAVAWS